MERAYQHANIGNHLDIYLKKTNFFLIISQAIERGCSVYFTYNYEPQRDVLNLVSQVPPISIMNRISGVRETVYGIQFELKDAGYIVLDTNILIGESIDKEMVSGYFTRIDSSFEKDTECPNLAFGFDNFRICIDGLTENTFDSIINGLPEARKQYLESQIS